MFALSRAARPHSLSHSGQTAVWSEYPLYSRSVCIGPLRVKTGFSLYLLKSTDFLNKTCLSELLSRKPLLEESGSSQIICSV